MSQLLWRFWIYSFLGFLLETAFAAATRSQRRGRKCRLLLPLCPVYGLGVLAVLALPGELTDSFWDLALWGGLTATAVEYAVHWWYQTALGVFFWDYSAVPGNLRGRICLPFSAVWAVLLAVALPAAERWLAPVLPRIAPGITYWMLVVFAADTVCSWQILRRTRDTQALRLLGRADAP